MTEQVKLEEYSVAQLNNICGNHDENFKMIEDALKVEISLRGDELSLTGKDSESFEEAKKVIFALLKLVSKGINISRRDVIYALKLVKEDKLNRIDLKIKELRENNQLEDITILTTNENTGVDIVKFFSDKGLKVSHVYDMNKGKNTKKRRNEKWKFRGGTGRLKICSYHSYKGWQTPNVILVLDSCGSENIVDIRKNVNNAIFISMSRVKPNSMNGQFSFTCFNYLDEYDFLEKVF